MAMACDHCFSHTCHIDKYTKHTQNFCVHTFKTLLPLESVRNKHAFIVEATSCKRIYIYVCMYIHVEREHLNIKTDKRSGLVETA